MRSTMLSDSLFEYILMNFLLKNSTITMRWFISYLSILSCLQFPSFLIACLLRVVATSEFKKGTADMGLKFGFSCLLSLLVLLPALCSAYDSFTHSRAAYYGSKDGLGTPSGACGYGEFGRKVYGGNVAAVSKLFKDGVGCGACYQVRCTNPKLCTKDGVEIMVTDHGASDNTDFILSTHGFASMAYENKAKQLMAYGVVDIEYRRVPCKFPGHKLMVKVHENSRFPEYLAIIFIYQAGEKDILAVELWQEDYKKWVPMRRAFGAVWDMPTPPKGPLTLRFLASEDGKKKWVELKKVIPKMWKPGMAYDAGIQLY